MKNNHLNLLCCVIAVVLVVGGIAGSLQLMELRAEEPRRAIVAMEMILGKNYMIPKIFGVNYYNKPPLFNWLLAFTFSIAGSYKELWVRLPSVLSLFITSLLIYKIVRRYYTRQPAFIAAMLLPVSADILFYGAVDSGELDLFFTLIIFIQAIAVFYYSLKQKWWYVFIISYLLMAAGVLTKGLPSVLIQALLLLCWLVYIKQWKKLFTLQHITGMLLSVAIITGYFVLYHRKNDAFVYMLQLLTESTQRSIGINKWGRVTLNVLQAPLQLLYISFPASIILFYAINKKVRQQLKGDMLFAFSCMFTLIICGIFFLSPGTANRYIYPAFPFIAIMAAIIYTKAAAVMASSKWLAGCNAIVGVFIVLGAARIAYDVWVVPYQLKTLPQNYRNLTAKILHCTNNQPVYLTGEPRPSPVNSFLLIEDEQDSTYGAPLLPYQVPYYITKATGTIMHYDSVPRRGVFYLAPVEFLKDKKVDVYFTFFDNWVRRYVALVKF